MASATTYQPAQPLNLSFRPKHADASFFNLASGCLQPRLRDVEVHPKKRSGGFGEEQAGMHESSQCGNKGYTNLKPSFHSPAPEVRNGSKHTLYAELNRQKMTVAADGKVVWEGTIGPDALAFDGPVGIRSDNVRLELELFAEPSSARRAVTIPACKAFAE